RALFVQEFKNKKAIVRVYQAIQEIAMFKNTSPNTAIKEIQSCTTLDWNNENFEK
ncbi:24725_t:CDS:2, partial [Gigaspora margarita]